MEDELLESHSSVLRGVLLIILLIGIAAGVIFGYRTWKRFDAVQGMSSEVRTYLAGASQDFLPDNFLNAKKELQSASRLLGEMIQQLDSISVLGVLPFTKERYRTAVQFSAVAKSFTDTGIQLAELVEQITEPAMRPDGTISIAEVAPSERATILERTVQSIPAFTGIRAKLALNAQQLSAISDDSLDEPYRAVKYDLLQKSEFIEYTLGQVIPFMEVIPRFLGYADEKAYLVLLQDARRLRGTGGIIRLYGILRVKDGTITDFTVSNPDADAARTASVPAYVQSAEGAVGDGSALQDANWDFDFPSVAKLAIRQYSSLRGGEQIDGVIAVDHDFFTSLLRFTGPIRIRNTIFSADSFTAELDYHRASGSYRVANPPEKPNDPIADLVGSMIEAVNKMPFTGVFEVTKIVEARLHEKHILVWFDDEKLEEFAQANNWTGTVRYNNADYFMVVDENITDKDTDPYIERSIKYEVVQDSLERLNASMEITYRNNATVTQSTGHYTAWLRVIMPRGSEIFAVQGLQGDIHTENRGNVMIVSGIVPVRAFQKTIVRLEYRLPKSVAQTAKENSRYDLFVQHQPGSKQSLNVSLFFQKPVTQFTSGGFFSTPTAGVSAQEIGGVKFVSDLRVDREFMAQF